MANSRYRDPKTFGKKTLVLVMVATIGASAIMVNDIAITPAADFMFGAYGDATNFILSGPSLLMIPAALVTGVLLKHFSKKTIFVIGALLFTIGGLSCSFVLDSALFVCAMRAIIGLSVGMVASCCTALIAESFIDENKRGTMMGLWNAGMAVLGMVIGLAAAALVDESWQSVFKLYWMAVPILIVIVFCVPRTAPEKHAVPEQAEAAVSGEEGKMPWGRLLGNMAVYFVSMVILCGFYFLNAVYGADAGIGTASLAGIAATCINVGTLIGCLAFGLIYAKTKRFVLFEYFVLLAISYLLLAFAPSAATCLVAAVLLGVGNALGMSYFQTRVTVIVPPNQVSLALSVSMATLGIAQFCSTYFATFVMGVFPGGTMLTFSMASAAILVVGAVAAAVFSFVHKSRVDA